MHAGCATYSASWSTARPVVSQALPHPGPPRQCLDQVLQEARRFYLTLQSDAEIGAAMAARGLTAEKIAQALTDLGELEGLDQRQEYKNSRSQQATRSRNARRRAVADWMAGYQRIARIALRDKPELVEQLGLLVRS
jgi:hypothetical protein